MKSKILKKILGKPIAEIMMLKMEAVDEESEGSSPDSSLEENQIK